LRAAFPVKRACATNIIETESTNLSAKGDTIKLTFRPYEIKTLKLYI